MCSNTDTQTRKALGLPPRSQREAPKVEVKELKKEEAKPKVESPVMPKAGPKSAIDRLKKQTAASASPSPVEQLEEKARYVPHLGLGPVLSLIISLF